jgi:1,4-dihydroxy-2-naphthoate octaprenyltransferase
VIAFVRLGRPLFLGGGFILYALGAAIARAAGHHVDLRRYVLGQAAVTAFQWMTHYANDYFDLEADRANTTHTAWSGGSRVLAGGELPAAVALVTSLVLAALGIAMSAILVEDTTIAIALAATAALAWAYSAPPLRLCTRGLGELDTAIVVTVLVPYLGYRLQAPALSRSLVLSIVPLALLQLAMLLAIEFPDAAGDAAAGKRTLVVRLGARGASRLYAAAVVAAYAWLPFAYALGLPARVALAAAIPLPLAAWRLARLADHADPNAFDRVTWSAVVMLVATSAAELAAWLV